MAITYRYIGDRLSSWHYCSGGNNDIILRGQNNSFFYTIFPYMRNDSLSGKNNRIFLLEDDTSANMKVGLGRDAQTYSPR